MKFGKRTIIKRDDLHVMYMQDPRQPLSTRLLKRLMVVHILSDAWEKYWQAILKWSKQQKLYLQPQKIKELWQKV